jgi:hypothetical protein
MKRLSKENTHQILTATKKLPETVDEFLADISNRGMSDKAIKDSIAEIEKEFENETTNLDKIELSNQKKAYLKELENRKA